MTENFPRFFSPPCLSNQNCHPFTMLVKTRDDSIMAQKCTFEQINSPSEGSGKVFDPRLHQAMTLLERKDEDASPVAGQQTRHELEQTSLSRPSLYPPKGSKEGDDLLSLGSLVDTNAKTEYKIANSIRSEHFPQGSDKNGNLSQENHRLWSDQLPAMQPWSYSRTPVNNSDVSFQMNQFHETAKMFPQPVPFGSPITLPSLRKPVAQQQDLFRPTLVPWTMLSLLDGADQARVAASRLNGAGKPTVSQLTIFYNGTVNVYDSIPADKAHAIMLLAGSGSPSVSHDYCDTPINHNSSHVISRQNEPPSSVAADSSLPRSSTMDATTSLRHRTAFAFPVSAPMASSLVAGESKQQQAPRRSQTSDLPVARKASLVRFLERRKDRVQTSFCKNEMEDRCNQQQEADCLHPDSIISTPKRQCTRSQSPSSGTRPSRSPNQVTCQVE